ncbi:hypothetical protein AVDCRST_MAG94-2227 [uncultured Leptolyngbya sp.]|uniref:Uncharacterized protein n=1 Tax=uncultured Leptolyngbya sp. TaxID=332963 RepID=A0A6J4LV36_9CYAN|nr:hypothetical protein AVDCRST_MAG94-2227 [uncultured Leptolyngbya sp.]
MPSDGCSGHLLKPPGTVTLGFQATGTPAGTNVSAFCGDPLRSSIEEIERLLP